MPSWSRSARRAATVERPHQLTAQPLAKRLGANERFQFGYELGVATGGKIGLDPALHAFLPLLRQPRDVRLRERLEREVRQRRPSPERQRAARVAAALAGSCSTSAAPSAAWALNRTVSSRSASRWSASTRRAPDECRRELPPQLRDVHLDGVPGRSRRMLTPEIVDQPVDRDDLAEMEREVGDEHLRFGAAEAQGLAVPSNLERAEQQDLERARIGHGPQERVSRSLAVA
jgi:hypothetical protein